MDQLRGKVVIVSGPSGVGKSTVVRGLLDRFDGRLRLSVSATTRPPRPGEQDGREYHFLSDAQFAAHHAAGEFLEAVEVFGRGHWYGTLRCEVDPRLAEGVWVLLEVDVEGAKRAKGVFQDAVSVFITPSSMEELERRLRDRGTETPDAISRRLAVAKRELAEAGDYQHQVINDRVEDAVDEISQILVENGINEPVSH
ncbi:Guanylate kinase [Pirellulimonas nuda]|uniref:Guanylate kinase n=1 Tax=Pirellulimonas nuda TaxID=2528009 RepID=A0A518DGR8_9BACT|nr:guanylate kinase [Pirellulimonas nuda]QDU90667.1 Guanylate kinase [Pirellulimonas nuda]